MRDHTVLPATRHLNSTHAGRYSIYLPCKDGRLSWPSWLDSAPAGSWTSDRCRTAAPPRQLIVVSWHVVHFGLYMSVGGKASWRAAVQAYSWDGEITWCFSPTKGGIRTQDGTGTVSLYFRCHVLWCCVVLDDDLFHADDKKPRLISLPLQVCLMAEPFSVAAVVIWS